MARAVMALVGLALAMCTAAQRDSARTGRVPWLELMAGARSPAGLIGFGAGVPCSPRITPAVALGFGIPEGAHLTAGMEYRIAWKGRVDLGAFAYWTYTTGRHNNADDRDTHCTPGQMLKTGFSLLFRAGDEVCTLRAGYGGYLVNPEYHEAWGGFANPGPGARTLEGGVLVSIGLRIPLVTSHEVDYSY